MTSIEKQRIFSYLRKSTKKHEQEASIERQKNHVETIAKRLGLNIKDIEYFIDNGKSGFKGSEYQDSRSEKIVRKREGYDGMLNEIRKQKQPCIVLAWAISRIARDSKEGSAIHNLLGNNKKRERKINSVHFLDGTVWNEFTTQAKIYTDIAKEEESSREKSIWKSERLKQALSIGLYPNEIPAPKGLKNIGIGVKENGIAGGKLKEDEKIPYIRKAFEMKAEGLSNREIYNYLKIKGVVVSESNMHTILFKNSVYVGYYTDHDTGMEYRLKYVSGKPPIDKSLFDIANGNIGKKKGKYGDRQNNDLISKILKTRDGYRFSVDIKQDKYRYYINKTKKLYISENNIIQSFQDVIHRICYLQYLIFIDTYYSQRIHNFQELIKNAKGFPKEDIDYLRSKYLIREQREYENERKMDYDSFLEKLKHGKLHNIYSKFKTEGRIEISEGKIKTIPVEDNNPTSGYFMLLNHSKDEARASIKRVLFENGNEKLREMYGETADDIEYLQKKKEKIVTQINNAKKNAILNGFSKEDVEEATKELNNEIKEIEREVQNLESSNITEQELDQFTMILLKIFEQADSMLKKGKKEVTREEFLLLLKMTTFELNLNPSEPLHVELFEGLKKVLYGIGTPTENRTPVPGMRILCPNH